MAKQTVTNTVKERKKKIGAGMEKCHICHGSGQVPKQKKKK